MGLWWRLDSKAPAHPQLFHWTSLTECKFKIKLQRIFNGNCKRRAGLPSKYGASASTLVVRPWSWLLIHMYLVWLKNWSCGENGYCPSKLHLAPATISVIASFGVVVVSVPWLDWKSQRAKPHLCGPTNFPKVTRGPLGSNVGPIESPFQDGPASQQEKRTHPMLWCQRVSMFIGLTKKHWLLSKLKKQQPDAICITKHFVSLGRLTCILNEELFTIFCHV